MLASGISHVVFGLRAMRLMVPVLLGPMLGVLSLRIILVPVSVLLTPPVFVVIIVLAIVFLSSLPLLLTLGIGPKTLAAGLVGVCLLFRV